MLPARALRTIRKHDLFPRGARVLVALSGGADSVALLHILRVLERRGLLVVAGVAHLHHGLRGADADADERFCRDLAARERLAIEVGHADVGALAARSQTSLESAARAARYQFLAQAAARLAAEVTAVGHTLDDQAETVLLRLFRGAGARGLSGIRPKAGGVVRPLLETRRHDLRRYAAEHGLTYREDASNADPAIPRNRIRLDVLPCLERQVPGLAPALARLANIAREDEIYLSSMARELFERLASRTDMGVQLEAAGLAAAPRALASRVVRQVLEDASTDRFVAAHHIDRVVGLATARGGASAVLPGCIVTRRGDHLLFGNVPRQAPFSNARRLPLPVPGDAVFGAWQVSAEPRAGLPASGLPPARGMAAVVAAGALQGPLAVRSRRPGDRFRPLGMGGRGRKLQDLLVDRKVARSERDALPLVVDAEDRIVWVTGQAMAEEFRVTEPSQPVILLKARRLGGPG
jgi:tRNA(Ile)-lysidine synthase